MARRRWRFSGGAAALVGVCALAAVSLCVRAPGSAVLYGVGGEDWWGSRADSDSYADQISRGGRQSWEGHADTFWSGNVESPGKLGASTEADSAFLPPTEPARQDGGVDITDVGEGTERVRLGLEGEWSGMASASRPGVDQEGAGAGWLRPSSAGASVRGGYGEDGYDILDPPSGASAYPMTSSYAYERTPDRWISKNGDFPGGIEEGTFPGVKPNDPDGTSWMIGMHRDGEETVGRWATAPRRRRDAGLARKQQLALLNAGVLHGGARPRVKAGEGSFRVLRSGRGRSVLAREQELLDDGADITDLGETNRDHHVYGGYGAKPEPTSWVVGEHRRLHWSDSQTYACSTTSLCKKGKADIRHSFQADTNPYVDKRRVFNAEAQLDPSDDAHGRDAYPWDPTLDPQVFRSARPHCGDGKLRDECWKRLGRKGDPPIPVSETVAEMKVQIKGAPEKRPRFRDGVRLLRGAEGYELGDQGLLDAPIGSDSWDEGDGRERSTGDQEGPGYPIAHYKEPLKELGDRSPFNGSPPYGDHSNWPYAAYEAHESWPTWAARPGSSGGGQKKLDAAVPSDYYNEWGLGSNARVLNSGHTGGAPHDRAGDNDRGVDVYNPAPLGAGAMGDKALATTALHSHSSTLGAHANVYKRLDKRGSRGGARGRGAGRAGDRDSDWEEWVNLALA